MDVNQRGAITALDRAIEVCDGVGGLARAIGVRQSTVSMWRSRGRVPADHCPEIEAATRARGRPVVCEVLCPHVAWHVVRSNPLS